MILKRMRNIMKFHTLVSSSNDLQLWHFSEYDMINNPLILAYAMVTFHYSSNILDLVSFMLFFI